MSGSRGEGQGKSGERCQPLDVSLAAYVEGVLPPDEARVIAEHVAGCHWCAARVAAFAGVDALVRSAPSPEPPASLRAGLYARIAAPRTQPPSTRHPVPALERIMPGTDSFDTSDVPAAVSSPSATHPATQWSAPSALAHWAGLVAAVLVVGLLASVFAMRGQTGTTGPSTTSAPTTAAEPACPPDQVRINLPAGSVLSDLVMTSPGTGWAVGSVGDTDGASTTTRTLIMRLSACQWQPSGASLPDAQLYSIAMVSSGEGWAAGTQGRKALLLHYKDGTWRNVSPPPVGDITGFLDVAALPNGEVWVAGSTPPGTRPTSGVALLHLAEGTWTRIETSLSNVTDLGPTGPGDMWLVGYKSQSVTSGMPVLAHIQDGAVEQEIPLDPRDAFSAIRMLSPSDGWVMGQAYVSGNETSANPTVTRPLALHYDGSRWTEVNTGVRANARAIDVLGQGTAWAYTTERNSATGPEYITATQREMFGTWRDVAWPFTDVQSFSRLTCVTADDCWAIGSYLSPDAIQADSNGTVLIKPTGSLLLRYVNGAWHQYGHVT